MKTVELAVAPPGVTRNMVELPTWKFMKSPLKVEVGLIPMKVPEALPPVMKLEPKRTSELVVD